MVETAVLIMLQWGEVQWEQKSGEDIMRRKEGQEGVQEPGTEVIQIKLLSDSRTWRSITAKPSGMESQ